MSFNDKHIVMDVGPVNLDGDVSHVVGTIQGTGVVQQVDLFNNASGASHATNKVTYSLINGGTDGTGTTVVATADTSATNFPQYAPFNLAVTAANATITDGQVLILKRDEANTDAPAQAAGVCQVRYLQTVVP